MPPTLPGLRGVLRSVTACVVVAITSPVSVLTGQSTFHVYADANYGDDQRAAAQNPNPTASPFALQAHPSASPNIPGLLQQAPYSFRTLTQALLYAQSFGPLPWIHPNHPERSIEFIVIHVLPGLYGPNPDGTERDAHSGLRGVDLTLSGEPSLVPAVVEP